MNSFFSEAGNSAFDFIYITTFYLFAMLTFFGLPDRKHRWLKYGSLVVFALQCLFIILFHRGLNVKLFAGLLLISTLIVQALVTRRRNLAAAEVIGKQVDHYMP